MSVDPNDWLLSAGVKSAKFAKVGDSITGTIARQPETQQQRDPATGETKRWNDGNPQLQLRVVLKTDERDPEDPDDTGERALYVKSGMREAVANAVRAAGAEGLEVGGLLWVKFHGEGKATQRGLNPPKLYQAKYKRPAVAVPVAATTLQEAGPADPALIGDEAPF